MKKNKSIYIKTIIDGIEYIYIKDHKTDEYHLFSRKEIKLNGLIKKE